MGVGLAGGCMVRGPVLGAWRMGGRVEGGGASARGRDEKDIFDEQDDSVCAKCFNGLLSYENHCTVVGGLCSKSLLLMCFFCMDYKDSHWHWESEEIVFYTYCATFKTHTHTHTHIMRITALMTRPRYAGELPLLV